MLGYMGGEARVAAKGIARERRAARRAMPVTRVPAIGVR
jgi:hypothetical protein